MRQRLLTAAWALPLLGLAVIYLPPVGFAVLMGAVAAVGQWELYRMHFRGDLPWVAWAGCLLGAVTVVAIALGIVPLAVIAGATALLLMLRLWTERPMDTALVEVAVVVLGLLYVAGLLVHIPLLRGLSEGDGIRWVFLLLLITWVGDSAALLVGRRFGKRRLTAISPNKTVAGTVGGIGASIVAAYTGTLFVPGLGGWDPLFIGVLLGVAALVGDLVESLFKRGAGVKDSSQLIAGHGGVMDKLDAFLFTAPALFYYGTWFVIP